MKKFLILRKYARLSSFLALGSVTLAIIFLWSVDRLKALETKVFRTSLIIGRGEGRGEGEFQQPSSVAIDKEGNIYVADTFNNRVQIFTPAGNFIRQFGGEGAQAGHFRFPKALVLDAGGYLYVADTGNHRVQKFTQTGDFLLQFGGLGSAEGEFNSPEGLAFAKGALYVADTQNHRIQKFTAEGKWLTSWGSIGTEQGQFVEPAGVAVDDKGTIWVVDTGNHRLQSFDGAGQYLLEIGRAGKNPGELDSPRGIAIDAEGNLYVADTANSRIQIFGLHGDLLWVLGHLGQKEQEFSYPTGVALDSDGTLYVADTINHRIQRLTFSLPAAYVERGWKLYEIGNHQEAITQWTEALAIDSRFSPALYALGTALLQEGDFSAARERFQAALAISPDYSRAHWGIYQSYLQQFRFPLLLLLSLLVVLCAVMWTRHHRWRVLWHKAEEQRKKRNIKAAIPLYEQILSLKRNDLAACKILEDLYQREGMEPKRTAVNQMIAKLEPTNVSALSYLGKTFSEEGNFTEAAAIWRRVIARDPTDREGYFYLGVVTAEQGEAKEAYTCFQRALAPAQVAAEENIEPSDHSAMESQEDALARLFLSWQEFFSRCPTYRLALQSFQEARMQIAQAHFAQGKQLLEEEAFADAATVFRHAVALVPEEQRFQELYIQAQSSLLFEKGMRFYRAQQYTEAIPCFRKIAALDPFHLEARKYLRYAQQCLEGDFSERFRQLDLREGEK